MTKEQQDLAWACLPKEARDEIKGLFNKADSTNNFAAMGSYLKIFGKHNLTSDTEPEVMLMVSKKDVEEYKSDIEYTLAGSFSSEYSKGYWRGQQTALDRLFGDKCLPDKPINGAIGTTPPSYKLDVETDKEPSVQVEPMLKVGDEVWYGVNKCTINNIKGNVAYIVYNNGASWEKISQLRPYIEPNYRFDIGDKVKFSNGKIKIVRNRYASPYDEFAHYSVVTIEGQSPINVIESDLEPYTEPETKDMEEKELNLCELLKGCTGEWFYVTPCGEMELKEINKLELKPLHFSRDSINCLTKTDGRAYENGSCIIYPSRALYEKYPLYAKKAWEVWASERKPKYSLEIKFYPFKDGKMLMSESEEFELQVHSLEEAQQAAEAVREYLEKFHENNQTQ